MEHAGKSMADKGFELVQPRSNRAEQRWQPVLLVVCNQPAIGPNLVHARFLYPGFAADAGLVFYISVSTVILIYLFLIIPDKILA